MNTHSKIEHETIVNMTSKGQVLIPKELRERNGLVPGEPVRIGLNDRGEAVVLPTAKRRDETPEQRMARIRAAIDAFAVKHSTGRGTDVIMKEIRGDWEP